MKKSAVLLCIAALAMSAGAHAVVTINAYGTGTTSLDDNGTVTPFDMQSVTHPSGAKSVSGQGQQQNLNELYDVIAHASGAGSAFADAGVLRVEVHGLALIGPGAPNVPTVTHGTPRVEAQFGAAFRDSVEIQSTTLSVGSPAVFRATIRLNVVTNDPAGFTGAYGFDYQVGSYAGFYGFPNGLYPIAPSFYFELPLEIAAQVGDIIPVVASFAASAKNRSGYFLSGGTTYFGGVSETHVDASHTAQIFLDAITPGIELVAESKHNYSFNAVPEPEAYALLLVGLGIVGFAARRSGSLHAREILDGVDHHAGADGDQ